MTIRIPSRPISIVDFGPIQIFTTRSNRRSRFRSNIEYNWSILIFFSIKIDRILSISIIFQLKDQKNCLKVDYLIKKVNLYRKCSKKTGLTINFDILDQIRSIFDINQLFRQDLIDFVTTIRSDSKISDRKSLLKVDLNMIWNEI